MNVQIYGETIALCKKFIDQVEKQNNEIEIYLDDDESYLHLILRNNTNNDNIVLMSNIKEFQKFILANGVKKMYVDINLGDQNGIDLAEDMGLADYFGELIFVSNREPSKSQFKRIYKMSAKFISKSILIDKIIYREPS